jgi:phage host-nuclease inhibitor protein Gam
MTDATTIDHPVDTSPTPLRVGDKTGAASTVREIASLVTKIEKKQARIAKQQLAIKAEAAAVDALVLEAEALAEAVYSFAQPIREELEQSEGRKTIELRNAGEIGWGPKSTAVVIDKDTDKVIASIKKLKLDKEFLRIKTEINKVALGDKPDVAQSIHGVTIVERESFFIAPLQTKNRFSRPVGPDATWSLKSPRTKSNKK